MEPKPMPRVFISYRRGDDEGYARLLDQTLSNHFGDENVFRDISDLRPGTLFDETIDDEINTCDFLLAVIGKRWLDITKEKAANKQEDFARLEISTALRLRPRVKVIPVVLEGAELPSKADLPDDLKDLVRHHACMLSDRWWNEATDQLIKEIKEEFSECNSTGTAFFETQPVPAINVTTAEPPPTTARAPVSTRPRLRNSRLSFYCGSAAGLLSAAVIAVVYTAATNLEWSRPLLVGAYGAAVGAIVSGTINAGIKHVPLLLGNSTWSRLVGSVLGGIVGGIAAAILAVFVFGWLTGPEVNPHWVAIAGIISNFAIAIGILIPELRQGGEKRVFAIVILVLVTAVIWFVVSWLLNEYQDYVVEVSRSRSPFSLSVVLLGAVIGMLLGVQVGATVFFSERSVEKP